MDVILHLPPEKEAIFTAEARESGLSLEEWMLDVASRQIQTASIAHLQKTNPQEWAKHFDAWVNSHRATIPVLSDEAMSRESIYPDPV